MNNSAAYWENRYQEEDTPWDLGYASPALIRYIEEHVSQEKKILIPGAGNAYEIGTLWDMGYHEVYICDWSESAIKAARNRHPNIPPQHFIQADFFELEMDFDLVVEQTFFCAIPPDQRKAYAVQVHRLLAQRQGGLIGVLFNRTFPHEGPPHGGNTAEYRQLFEQHFESVALEESPHSVDPRREHEVFIQAFSPIGAIVSNVKQS